MNSDIVILAFSGGLDTSFCVPYLIEKGYQVHTVFVNTGAVSNETEQQIEKRAYQLGAVKHWQIDGKEELFEQIVTPMLWANTLYQNKYPALCADRYLIAKQIVKLAKQLNTNNLAHGCTGMGNDQVRFDLSIHAQGDYNILSPIRDIQKQHNDIRNYEVEYLQQRGFTTPSNQNKYSINENLLGVTISGSEIDLWKAPTSDTHIMTCPSHLVVKKPTTISISFENGVLTELNQQTLSGSQILQQLNQMAGNYGIGRGIYTGDTVIGLKGRIVFEAPGLHTLLSAHKALEEVTLTQLQNNFKATVANQWMELIYKGFYFDPLYQDIYAFLQHNQKPVTGRVTLQFSHGQVLATEVVSENLLSNNDATYAQSASWGAEQAMGFIELYGKSTSTWAKVKQQQLSESNYE